MIKWISGIPIDACLVCKHLSGSLNLVCSVRECTGVLFCQHFIYRVIQSFVVKRHMYVDACDTENGQKHVASNTVCV